MILRHKTYFQLFDIFEHLMPFVFPLCVFTYILTARHLVEWSCSLSQEEQNPRLTTLKDAAKIVLELPFVFLISYVDIQRDSKRWTQILTSIFQN